MAGETPARPETSTPQVQSTRSIPSAEIPPVNQESEELYLSPHTLLTNTQSLGPLIYVDTRLEEEFNRTHLPGAINIQRHALKVSDYLKPYTVILLDKTGCDPMLGETCRNLRRLGYQQVKILKGGLNYWQSHAGAMVGLLIDQSQLSLLSPREWVTVRQATQWTILQLAGSSDEKLPDPFSAAIPIPAQDQNTEAIFKHLPTNPTTIYEILVINETGDYPDWLQRWQRPEFLNLFLLEGGLQAYRRFETNQTATETRIIQTIPAEKSCATCP